MIRVVCPSCRCANDERRRWMLPDRLWHPDERFSLVTCGQCGFLFLNPRPVGQEMDRHYPDLYYAAALPDAIPAPFLWRLLQIEKYRRHGRLLDVGCGNGIFLHFARLRGWDAYGVDNSGSAVERARRLLGERVALGALPEARYAAASFDVITLFEVLEHVPGPREYLDEVHRILMRGGWLCLSVPNFDSLERVVFGRWWNGLDAPRHLQQFTRQSLRRLLEHSGFQIAELSSVNADRIQLGKTRISYAQDSLRFFLSDLRLYPPRARSSAQTISTPIPPIDRGWRRSLHRLEWLVFGPLCFAARWSDRENSLWAVGRKA